MLRVTGYTNIGGNLLMGGELFNATTGAYFLSIAIANVNYPTYGFYNDNGLGMYRPTADTLGFVTNDTERIRITSGGNVLIGTTTDNGNKLQVNGAITAVNVSLTGELVTTSTTFNTTYYHIISGGIPSGQTYTLPSPSSNNLQYVIINKSSFSQTISAGSGFTIFDMTGANSATITLVANGRCFIIADGSGFYQIF
jgi:hypothetical protein